MLAPGKIEYRQIEIPVPEEEQVRIRVQRIGVCGSDIHVFHGKHPFVTYPLIQGHEFAGIVEAVGKKVDHIQVGDKVTATPQETCGQCSPCRRGQYNACEVLKVRGFQAPGCAQDFFVTEADKVVKLPVNFKPEQGVFVEPVAVAAHSTERLGDLSGKNVVVSGAGTIGNFVAQACKCRGARTVLIADISDFRLTIAKQVGIDAVCNVRKRLLADAVKQVFGYDGFEAGVEVAGVHESLSSLISGVGKGGTVLIVGVYEELPKVNMSVVCEHELTVKGSMMYRYEDWRQAVAWIASGQIQTNPLDSRHFSFEQYTAAYEFIKNEGDKVMKVMIDLD
jgi:L-iditol 2-dehydrogenase/threonine 3-dehydrogenase